MLLNHQFNHTLEICFTEAVRKNVLLAKATDTDIEEAAKEWLKYACDRGGGRKERERRKMAQAETLEPTSSE